MILDAWSCSAIEHAISHRLDTPIWLVALETVTGGAAAVTPTRSPVGPVESGQKASRAYRQGLEEDAIDGSMIRLAISTETRWPTASSRR